MLHGFEVETDWAAVAHAFSQAFRVREYADGSQCLWIAFEQNPLTRIGAKRRRNDFLARPKLGEFQIAIDLGNLQVLTLIFANVISKGLDDAVGGYIVLAFGAWPYSTFSMRYDSSPGTLPPPVCE